MKNLAGVEDCDITIKEELYLADIEMETVKDVLSEVPYTIIGRIGMWTFRRAWKYWAVSVVDTINGLPLNSAMKLHNTPHPIEPDRLLGHVIRAGGHGAALPPNEYGAGPVYNEELDNKLIKLGYEEKYYEALKKSFISITVGEISKLHNEGKLDADLYVDIYHIDTQIGLTEFVKFLKTTHDRTGSMCRDYDSYQGRGKCVSIFQKSSKCTGVCEYFKLR